MVYPIAKHIVLPPVRLWLKKLYGLENLPRDRGFIIAANHQSYLDHYFIGYGIVYHLNKKLHFLAKKEHFDNPIEAAWHRYCGAVPLDRSTDGSETFKTAVKYLRRGAVIGLYPEGTRSLDGNMIRAKTGIVRLALQAQVPIIPCGIRGTFEILPKGQKLPSFARGTVHFGKPILFSDDYDKKITKELLRSRTTHIMKMVGKLAQKKYPE